MAFTRQVLQLASRGCWGQRRFVRTYGTAVIRDVLKLCERGVFQSLMPELSAPDFKKKLQSPQPVYCGFDPTAESLHIGNLLAIIALIHFQRAGHIPIALIGGATVHIGDPSGKSKDRDVIEKQAIQRNIDGLCENLERIFTNHAVYLWKDDRELRDVRLMNNKAWYEDVNVIDFLTGFARHFRLSYMLRKDSVKGRLGTAEGMSFTEFTYQIFQAYDWVHLLQNHDCHIQIGGHDQIGNITSGMEVIDKLLKTRTYGLTVPLVTTSGGQKLGKSEGNALWLDPCKTSPYHLYQYFINIPDQDVANYLSLFTFLPDNEISDIMLQHKLNSEHRKPQKKLAENVLLLVHGEAGLQEAIRWTEALFDPSPDTLADLSREELEQLFASAPTTMLPVQYGLTVRDLLLKIKGFNRTVDADRVTMEGGVSINKVKVRDPEYCIDPDKDILRNNITLIRIGKKKQFIVKWDREAVVIKR